jgi:L-aminopeptidase/D-esterase-like protein
VARGHGDLVFKLTTQNLVDSADSYAKQLNLMKQALEGEPVNKLDETLTDLVSDAVRKGVSGTKVYDLDGDLDGELKHPSAA